MSASYRFPHPDDSRFQLLVDLLPHNPLRLFHPGSRLPQALRNLFQSPDPAFTLLPQAPFIAFHVRFCPTRGICWPPAIASSRASSTSSKSSGQRLPQDAWRLFHEERLESPASSSGISKVFVAIHSPHRNTKVSPTPRFIGKIYKKSYLWLVWFY